MGKNKKRFWQSSDGEKSVAPALPEGSLPEGTPPEDGQHEASLPDRAGQDSHPAWKQETASPEMARVGELLRASADGLGGSLSSLRAPLDELRGAMQDLVRVTAPERLEVAAQAALAPMRRDLEKTLGELQRQLDETRRGLKVLDTFVTQEQVDRLVQTEARQAASRHEADLQARLEELQAAFEDADDRYGRIKKLIDAFGPGGLPVLHQENASLRESLSRGEKDLREARAHIGELEGKVAGLERELLRFNLTQGVITLEELENRRKALSEREADLRGRETLEAENQRLAKERDELSAELSHWRELERAEQQRQADLKELERLREESRNSATAYEKSETARRRAEKGWEEARRQLASLEARLAEVQEFEQVARQREQRLNELETERRTLIQNRELARQERDQLRREMATLTNKLDELQRELAECKARESLLEVEWREGAAEVRKQELEQLRRQFESWAESEAQSRAARALEELRRERQRSGELEAELGGLKQRGQDLQKRNQVLEAERQIERDVLEMQRRQLAEDQDSLERRSREQEDRVAREEQEARTRLERQTDGERARQQQLQAECVQLESRLSLLSGQVGSRKEELESLLQRIGVLQGKAIPRAERIQQLIQPVFSPERLAPVSEDLLEEVWLKRVEEGLRDSGFRFHTRLLRAFHTSLKVAQSSPLTVLAGISGTGKSELPRLYADIGGLSFLPVAVQPGWDSPSDLFGFFNYTDGRLRAEPLARLLYQVNEKDNPLREGLTIVLLDEMNLARVEYYFSELLSKLEARRGAVEDEGRKRASITIDVGAGEDSQLLYLDERVLFVGTMNEDESTHTLSDKVLDRACVLSFPSPRNMRFERQSPVLREQKRLPFETWRKWCAEKAPGDISSKLNEINGVMEELGRPFGHRLFRAIHAYVSQYPASTPEARDDAWSDQWAMKVLPRLKGLECGARRVADGLDRLAELIPADLKAAFVQSRREDYFAWRGAADLYRIPE